MPNQPPWQDAFLRKFSVTSEKEKEMQLKANFVFVTKKEMADPPYNKDETLKPHI